MRALRTLAVVGLTASLLAIPALSSAQSEVDTGGDNAVLARQPDGLLPLEHTPWRLVAYRDGDRVAVPGPEVAAFLEFGHRLYEGSGGCSKVKGTYGVTGAALKLQPRQLEDRTCAENLTVVQQAVENGLRQAVAFSIEPGATGLDDELVLYSVIDTELLRYGLDDVAQLDGAQWRLESYTSDGGTVPVSADMPGLISFRPDSEQPSKRRQSGSISATSGCNAIVAEFYRQADVLSFSELELTDAPCTAELTAQEAAMAAVLDATAIELDLPADRLTLTSSDTGEMLEFVSQTPLEGTTWWLERTAADGTTDGQRITLRLEAGVAGGEGPCGAYTADYVTDGVFITFSDARGARGEDCEELRTERALISGLRRSVAIERGLDRLVLRDANGSTQLDFGRPFAP